MTQTGMGPGGGKEGVPALARRVVPLLIALAAACAPQSARAPRPRPESADTREWELQALEALVNEHRERVGCRPLTLHNAASRVADRHSRDMAGRNFFAHENPDGDSPADRLERASIVFRAAAENIAFGQRDAPTVMASWLSSPPHRRNIENCAFTHHGAGLYATRWTHVLLTP